MSRNPGLIRGLRQSGNWAEGHFAALQAYRHVRDSVTGGSASPIPAKWTGTAGVASHGEQPRAGARRVVRRAGGTAEDRVSHRTDIVVVGGQSPHWKAEKKGQKLLDADY